MVSGASVRNDHLEKQRRGAFSLTYRGNQGEPLAEALHARMKCVPGSPEFDAAQTVIDQETDAIAKAQPSQRHTVRMSAVYLDLTSDGKSWNRPTVIDAQAAFERLNDASNDYSVGKQWFEEPLLSLDDDRLRALNPKTALLKMAKPAGLTLPPAKWPKMPA